MVNSSLHSFFQCLFSWFILMLSYHTDKVLHRYIKSTVSELFSGLSVSYTNQDISDS